MADNILTPSSGATVATDEVATTGEHVQLFKLAYAADGSRVLVPADAGGVWVQAPDLARLLAQQLALMRAIHFQLTLLSDNWADPGEFAEPQ